MLGTRLKTERLQKFRPTNIGRSSSVHNLGSHRSLRCAVASPVQLPSDEALATALKKRQEERSMATSGKWMLPN